jgi:hypothetical protein
MSLVAGFLNPLVPNIIKHFRTNETAILLDCQDQIPNEIPDNSEFLQFFAPDFTLRPTFQKKIENANTKEVDTF